MSKIGQDILLPSQFSNFNHFYRIFSICAIWQQRRTSKWLNPYQSSILSEDQFLRCRTFWRHFVVTLKKLKSIKTLKTFYTDFGWISRKTWKQLFIINKWFFSNFRKMLEECFYENVEDTHIYPRAIPSTFPINCSKIIITMYVILRIQIN